MDNRGIIYLYSAIKLLYRDQPGEFSAHVHAVGARADIYWCVPWSTRVTEASVTTVYVCIYVMTDECICDINWQFLLKKFKKIEKIITSGLSFHLGFQKGRL